MFSPLLIRRVILAACFLYPFRLSAAKIIEQPQEGYLLNAPRVISQDKALPVLVCLPGWGVKAKNDINLWAFPADKRGFLLIELDIDYAAINSQKQVEALFARIEKIIQQLASNYNIDKNKLFLAGTSAGAMMAISLALLYPGRFKAMGIISGARLGFGAGTRLKNAKGQLFYFYHGKKDKSIPIAEFYATQKKLRANGAIIEFKVIEEGEHTLPSGSYKEVVDLLYQLAELMP